MGGKLAPTGPAVATTVTASESPDAADGAPAAEADGPRYAWGAEIARGGVGVVRTGVDRRLGRSVAIKELLTPSPVARARFQREARLTARLEHPGIVPLYDQDWGDDGEPFYVMRRVAGRSLASELAARATEGERLALIPTMLAVADTIAYAHSRGVIHRDLKPSNVLCGEHGSVIVIDWGLAKVLRGDGPARAERRGDGVGDGGDGVDDHGDSDGDGDGARATPEPELTSVGSIVGTPAYMAPEQARGQAVDERADVYALGAMLYHLLTGVAPHEARGPDGSAPVATSAPGPIRERAPGAPRDLVAVVDRAMARDVEARYRDAAGLARDLRAFLGGGLVSTYRYSARERLGRWVKAHRTVFLLGVVLGAALIATGVVSVVRITAERDRARTALALLDARNRERAVAHAAAELERDPTAAVAWLKQSSMKEPDATRIRSLAESAAARGVARDVFALDGTGVMVAADQGAMLATDERGSVWLWTDDHARRVAAGRNVPRAFAVRDGWALWGDRDGVAWRTRLATGETTELGRGAWVRAGAIAADGALWWADVDGVVRRAVAGQVTEIVRAGAPAAELAVDGERWAVGLDNGTVLTGGPGVPPRRAALHEREVSALRFVGDTLLTTAEDGRIMAWHLPSDARRELGRHGDWVSAIAVSPDGRRVATGSGDRTIRLTPLDGGPATVLAGHRSFVSGLVWTERGLVSAEREGVIRVWGATSDAYAGFSAGGSLRRLAWRGDALVGVVEDTVRVWAALPVPARHLESDLAAPTVLTADVDGRFVAAGAADGRFAVWSLADGRRLLSEAVAAPIGTLRFSRRGALVVATDTDAQIWTLDGEPRRVTTLVTGTGTADPAAFRDGARVAWVDHTRGAVVVVSADGPARTLAVGVDPADLTIAPAQDAIVTVSRTGEVARWPVDGSAVQPIGTTAQQLANVSVSSSGRWVISSPRSAATLVWPLAGGAARALAGTDGATSAPDVTGDDWLAVGVGLDVVLTPLDGGAPPRHLRGHRSSVIELGASDDGALIASGDEDGEVRLWRRAGGEPVVLGSFTPGALLRFVPGDRLVIAGRDEVLLYPDVSRLRPVDGGPLPAVLAGLTSAVIDDALAARTPR